MSLVRINVRVRFWVRFRVGARIAIFLLLSNSSICLKLIIIQIPIFSTCIAILDFDVINNISHVNIIMHSFFFALTIYIFTFVKSLISASWFNPTSIELLSKLQ